MSVKRRKIASRVASKLFFQDRFARVSMRVAARLMLAATVLETNIAEAIKSIKNEVEDEGNVEVNSYDDAESGKPYLEISITSNDEDKIAKIINGTISGFKEFDTLIVSEVTQKSPNEIVWAIGPTPAVGNRVWLEQRKPSMEEVERLLNRVVQEEQRTPRANPVRRRNPPRQTPAVNVDAISDENISRIIEYILQNTQENAGGGLDDENGILVNRKKFLDEGKDEAHANRMALRRYVREHPDYRLPVLG